MTRNELIVAILVESYGVGMGTDWATGVTDQEYQFQRWLADVRKRAAKRKKLKEEAVPKPKKRIYVTHLPDARHPPKGSRGTKQTLQHYRELVKQSTTPTGVLHHYKTLERESRRLKEEDEDKWKRMKGHIAASARARGISGKRFNAYVYGAMRDRGWKPRRERVDETVQSLQWGLNRLKKDFQKQVVKPFRGYRRAQRYKKLAYEKLAQGNYGRGLEMLNRADRVQQAHAPVLAGAAMGATTGVILPGVGTTEAGALLGAKGGQLARGVSRAREKARLRARAGG